MTQPTFGTLVAAACAIAWMTGVDAATDYRVDPASSSARIHVGKAGALSFVAGHGHEIVGPVESGSVAFDPDVAGRCRVSLVIAAAALKVSGAGEPARDVPKVQETMDGPKVLDVARFPRITFESTGVSIQERQGSTLVLAVTGRLTIRDVAQPVTVPVRLQLAGDAMTATGQVSMNQTAFGITPISVGGVVAVKDALEISFSIVARR